MKQIKNLKSFIALALVATVIASCHKDKLAPDNGTATGQRAGLYVLNEGAFTHNNSTLSYYDFTSLTLTPDIFSTANAGAKLGDVGNDAGIYGSKMFIVVNNSNIVDVVAAKGAKLIKQITLNQPRSVVFFGSNAFITSYDGTVSVIDTTALTISKTITVGPDPEQMVISNNKIYVANSGGLNTTANNTVSVIDPVALSVTKTITIPMLDPISMAADSYGHVYVSCGGVYGSVAPGVTVISNSTDAVITAPTFNIAFGAPIVNNGDFMYYITADNKVGVFNAKTQTAAQANFITDGTSLTAGNAITVDSNSGEVFVGDAGNYTANGLVYAFDKTGKKEYAITVGLIPGKIVLVNK